MDATRRLRNGGRGDTHGQEGQNGRVARSHGRRKLVHKRRKGNSWPTRRWPDAARWRAMEDLNPKTFSNAPMTW